MVPKWQGDSPFEGHFHRHKTLAMGISVRSYGEKNTQGGIDCPKPHPKSHEPSKMLFLGQRIDHSTKKHGFKNLRGSDTDRHRGKNPGQMAFLLSDLQNSQER
jgi:hypothetical protein